MKTSNCKQVILLTACLGIAGHLRATPSWIDVDFFATTNGSGVTYSQATITPYNPGAAAIGLATDVWNDIDIATPAYNVANLPASTSLHNVLGNATPVVLTVTSGVRGAYGSLTDPPAQNELFTPGFFGLNATISGLAPATTYDLYLYGPDTTANITVNGNAFPAWATISPGWGPNWVNGVGYNELALTTPASGTLTIIDSSTTEQITALQIVPAPEPSTYALAGLGGISLLAYRRRAGRRNTALPAAAAEYRQ